jgi:C1A family cysteine protease
MRERTAVSFRRPIVVLGLIILGAAEGIAAHQSHGSDIPSRFDWREKEIMTPVKHQMNLGSCGVFAAVAVFEALIKKETGNVVDLSEQQIINSSRDWVPSGISSVDAMKHMKQYGLVSEERLPYEDRQTDKTPDGPPDYTLTDYRSVVTHGLALPEKIRTIKEAVWQRGPVATNMVFYEDLDRYKQGLYLYDGKSKEQGGHWVVIVGWRDDPGVKNGGYWICRNSWGDRWGENGYFNIAYGECGIDDFWFAYGVFRRQCPTGE